MHRSELFTAGGDSDAEPAWQRGLRLMAMAAEGALPVMHQVMVLLAGALAVLSGGLIAFMDQFWLGLAGIVAGTASLGLEIVRLVFRHGRGPREARAAWLAARLSMAYVMGFPALFMLALMSMFW
jgi:hypothetical protein